MQMSGAEQQCQHAGHGFVHGKAKLAQQAERDQRRQHVDQYACCVTDHDAAHGGVVFIFGKDWPVSNPGACQVGRQHEQRLADAVPAVELAAAAVQAEFGIVAGKHLRLRSPEPVRGLQAVHGVGGAEFARLHDKGEQSRREAQEK